MQFFYMKANDTLMLFSKINTSPKLEHVSSDLIKLSDSDGNITGINLFSASKHIKDFDLNSNIKLSNNLASKFEIVCKEFGLDLKINLNDNIVIGKIEKIDFHPSSNKLSICKVDVGKENNYQIVCAAVNIKEGDKVVVALPNAILGTKTIIQETKVINYLSKGMICSDRDLGIDLKCKEKHVIICEEDKVVGTNFFKN